MRRAPLLLTGVLPAVAVTAALGWMARAEVSAAEVALTFPLAAVPSIALAHWQRGERRAIPLFALITAMFWVCYGLPSFRSLWTDEPGYRPDSLVPALALSDLGLAFFSLGFWMARHLPRTARVPEVEETAGRVAYMRAVLGAGALAGVGEHLALTLGEGGRNALLMLGDFIPLIAFAFLLRRQLGGRGDPIDPPLLAGYGVVRVVTALASGWIGSAVAFGAVLAFVYIEERRSVPKTIVLAVLAYVLVLQPAKNDFRQVFWYGGEQGSRWDRLAFWAGHSRSEWATALSGQGERGATDLAAETLSRMSLLEHSARILDMTPEVVPFQHGRLYSYLLVTLVPRFVWPDKPSVNEANRFYQVAYGVTPEWYLDNLSISCGFLGEAYINFGWWGVPFVLALVGVALRWFERNLLEPSSGPFLRSVASPFVSLFLMIEWQLAQYFGGLVQRVLLVLLVFWPAWRSASRPSSAEGGESVPETA